MSPKRQVVLLVLIFASLGIGVSVGIIAAGGGLGGPIDLSHLPTEKDIYHVGQDIKNGTQFTYDLDSVAPDSALKSARVAITFVNDSQNWNVYFSITNGTHAISGIQKMSNELTLIGQPSSQFKPYFEPIRLSVFAVRDMDYQGAPKYLVIGAPWNTIVTGSSSIVAKITGNETIQIPSGTYDTFVLSYKLAGKTSKLWISPNVALPVKAEVYDASDNLLYKYELVKYVP